MKAIQMLALVLTLPLSLRASRLPNPSQPITADR